MPAAVALSDWLAKRHSVVHEKPKLAQTSLHDLAVLAVNSWSPHSVGTASVGDTHEPLQARSPLQLSVTENDAVALRPAVSKKTAWKTRVWLSVKSIDSV